MKNAGLLEPSVNGSSSETDSCKRQLLATLNALKAGNFAARMPADLTGIDGKIADSLNEIIARVQRFGDNVGHLRDEVGRRGKIHERIPVVDAIGDCATRIENINSLVDDL